MLYKSCKVFRTLQVLLFYNKFLFNSYKVWEKTSQECCTNPARFLNLVGIVILQQIFIWLLQGLEKDLAGVLYKSCKVFWTLWVLFYVKN